MHASPTRAGDGAPTLEFRSSEEYSQLVSETFAPLNVVSLDPSGFSARIRRLHLPSVTVAHMACSPCEVAHPVDDSQRLIKVMLQMEGQAVLTQGDRQVVCESGSMIAYETSTAYELAFHAPYRTIVMGIPYARWGGRADTIAKRTLRPIDASAGIGPLVSTILSAEGAGNARSGQSLFADALVSLVTAAFVGDGAPDDDLATSFHDRVIAYCDANLHDPGLSVNAVAEALHVSVSYLQKRMQGRGIALGRWIRERRADRIVDDLRHDLTASITEIAYRWGVSDAAHLSRLLRPHIGMTAEDVRRGSRAAA